jgi:hypothetical protein
VATRRELHRDSSPAALHAERTAVRAGPKAHWRNRSHDETANVQAQLAGDKVVPEIQEDPTYAGSAIDPQGLTIYAARGGTGAAS